MQCWDAVFQQQKNLINIRTISEDGKPLLSKMVQDKSIRYGANDITGHIQPQSITAQQVELWFWHSAPLRGSS